MAEILPSYRAGTGTFAPEYRSLFLPGEIILPLREALPSSRFLPIYQTPHIAVCFGARRPLIYCPLPAYYLTASNFTYDLPLLSLYTRPRIPTATVKTPGNVTSMAEPTTPDAGPNFAPPSLPPGWCVFTSPLHTSLASSLPY